eukprot:2103455-Pleurochrysis_carterae.AAC.1
MRFARRRWQQGDADVAEHRLIGMVKRHHGLNERCARVADRGRVRGTQHHRGRGAPCLRCNGERAKVVSE